MTYIYKITRYDFMNSRNDEETTQFFSNPRAAAAYVRMMNGGSQDYYSGWDRRTAGTLAKLTEVLRNMSTHTELHLMQSENTARIVSATCYGLNSARR